MTTNNNEIVAKIFSYFDQKLLSMCILTVHRKIHGLRIACNSIIRNMAAVKSRKNVWFTLVENTALYYPKFNIFLSFCLIQPQIMRILEIFSCLEFIRIAKMALKYLLLLQLTTALKLFIEKDRLMCSSLYMNR